MLRVALRTRKTVGIALMTASLAFFAPPPTFAEHWAPPPTVYVSTTGHTADGLFLDLWRERRDLVGDPITEELQARASFSQGAAGAQVVQFYENVAFAYLPDAEPERSVQLLDLGRQQLTYLLDSAPSPAIRAAARRTECPSDAGDDCLLVPETGHTVQEPVLAYWQEAGGASWLGNPLTEAFSTPGGYSVQLFEFGGVVVGSDGVVHPLPLGRLLAKRLGLETDPIPKPDETPVFTADLFLPPPEPEPSAPAHSPFALHSYGPGPQAGAAKELVVSISQQSFWAYENGDVVQASLVSTGTGVVPETETPLGQFQILTKYEIQDMEGTVGGYYRVEDVPDILYFDNEGNAFHGTYWHNNFGARMSRGCVNLPLDVAAWLYDWAPIGTPVTILP